MPLLAVAPLLLEGGDGFLFFFVFRYKGTTGKERDVPEIIEIEKEKLIAVLESLQRKVPRLSRHSFSMAFDAAIAIEAKRALSVRAKLREAWKKGVINDHLVFERDMKRVETETDQRIAYLRSLQKEALEYYDGETEKVQERANRGNTRGFKHDGGGPRGCQSGPFQD